MGHSRAEGSTDGSSTAPSRSFVFLETLGACLLGGAAGELQGGAVFNCVGQARRRTMPLDSGSDVVLGMPWITEVKPVIAISTPAGQPPVGNSRHCNHEPRS